MARLILDTGVLVAIHRDRHEVAVSDDIAVPVLARTEFRVGALLDPDPARGARSLRFLDASSEAFLTVDYTDEVVEHHADLLVAARRARRPRGAHDLIIAATARATRRTLVTTDRRAGFDDLPGVDVRFVDP